MPQVDQPDVIAFMRDVRLFTDFTPQELTAIASRLRTRTLRKGEILIPEGGRAGDMFIVRRGRIVVSKGVMAGVEHVLERYRRGDFFGEASLFDAAPASVSVQAEIDTELLVLERDSLDHLFDASPRAARSFFETIAQECLERLERTHEVIAEVTRWGLEATGLELFPARL
jgi:CRP/FNR family transcriptional regulator, cyclic AMP receptor protein